MAFFVLSISPDETSEGAFLATRMIETRALLHSSLDASQICVAQTRPSTEFGAFWKHPKALWGRLGGEGFHGPPGARVGQNKKHRRTPFLCH